MKKSLLRGFSLLITLTILLTTVSITGSAAATDFELSNVEVEVDGTQDVEITIDFRAKSALTIISADGYLNYTEDQVERTDYENANITMVSMTPNERMVLTGAQECVVYAPGENDRTYGVGAIAWGDQAGIELAANEAVFTATFKVSKDTPEGTYTVSTVKKKNANFKTQLSGDRRTSAGTYTATITVTRVEPSNTPTINFVAVNPNDSSDETDDSETYSEDMPIPEVMPKYEYYDRGWTVGSEGEQISLTQENGEWSATVPEGGDPITIPEGSTEQEALDAVLAAYIASHPEAETIEVDAVYTRQTYQVTLNANVNGAETSIYTTDNYEVGHSVRLVAPATYEGGAFGYWIVKDVPYYDTNGELAYKDMQYDNRDMTFVSVAPSRNGGPFEAYAYYGVQSQAEFPLSLRIANQYGEIASGNHKIVMTLELTAPEKVTAVGFLYTTDQDAMGEGPTIGMWNAKTSGTVAKKGAGTYTLRLNVGQATEKEVAVCAYVIYKGKTYYASTGGMAAEGAHGDCYDVLTWDALAN